MASTTSAPILMISSSVGWGSKAIARNVLTVSLTLDWQDSAASSMVSRSARVGGLRVTSVLPRVTLTWPWSFILGFIGLLEYYLLRVNHDL